MADVEGKTGKTMEHWTEVLDSFDVGKNGHKAAAKMLLEEHGQSPWWSQQITILYEQAKGLRKPGQRHSGTFTVNVSKTIRVSAEKSFDAWSNAESWNRWFTTGAVMDFRVGGSYKNDDKDIGVFKKIREPGAARAMDEVGRIEFTWENADHCPGSLVIVQVFDKGPEKSTVAITHVRLPDLKGCQEMKEGWSWALASLKSWLETGVPVGHEDWLAAQKG